MLALDYSVRQKINDAAGGTLLHVAAAEGHVLTAHILFQVLFPPAFCYPKTVPSQLKSHMHYMCCIDIQ
jgi:hypothetical protein